LSHCGKQSSTGVLKPGERLMEAKLAEEMGVSRTPVREAIRKLELEGFIVMIPRKGAYVAGISLKDIVDVFEVWAALESLAAGLAAERITAEELEQLYRFRTISLSVPSRMRASLEEQKKLAEAIAERDISLAQILAQEHIENAENNMIETVTRMGLLAK